ncbi:hypothetical protein Val02_25840 [Virgisporangium aliadipatigenens]|uniref:DUF6891 domain-containing protein n=1 Tax=Virgisporangium aliadipatigenens TaxID=741659 RepID=A0A8J3YKY3_9ACTN|nr:hypothetical protein [Virgisporangium aliadipatigenens]GIJ45698.1 hypothetical protein Val02_25840 [Virgisporangium aliadipatigenens]
MSQTPAPDELRGDDDLPGDLEGARDLIRTQVAAGYAEREQIREEALEYALDEPPEEMTEAEVEAFVDAELERALREQAERQAGFPEVTDYDRLHAAFEELERDGIVARENFSCCGNCGAAEIGEEMERHGSARGYTFFHQQDTESAVESGGLYLNYGADSNDEADWVAVGHEVVAVLRRHDLDTTWSGKLSKRIMVAVNWQRRRP